MGPINKREPFPIVRGQPSDDSWFPSVRYF
jgi:hypothetical protein